MPSRFRVNVASETGRLRALLVHSPDSGLGKVVPSKAQDWLFEDIVHLPTARREYDTYLRLLLWFLDPETAKTADRTSLANRSFFIPGDDAFYKSTAVLELQVLLTDILVDPQIRAEIIAAVCALEGCTQATQQSLSARAAADLSKIILSGSGDDGEILFAPVPNLIFTRDIGVTINDHILLSRPAKTARSREALLARYLFFYHPLFSDLKHHILEIPGNFQSFLRPKEEQPEKITLEGGDVMVVSSKHVLIGCSERTTPTAAKSAMNLLFEHAGITKVTLIGIPAKRDFMHIDTLFTQVRKDTWVLLKQKDELSITQYQKQGLTETKITDLEELLKGISRDDLGVESSIRFIYSGNDRFPYDAREQWTDSCNLLALKEGVVLGYDRNDKTNEAFLNAGFSVREAAGLLEGFENGSLSPGEITNTLVLIPSSELSRARGGFHCMSMPLWRDDR